MWWLDDVIGVQNMYLSFYMDLQLPIFTSWMQRVSSGYYYSHVDVIRHSVLLLLVSSIHLYKECLFLGRYIYIFSTWYTQIWGEYWIDKYTRVWWSWMELKFIPKIKNIFCVLLSVILLSLCDSTQEYIKTVKSANSQSLDYYCYILYLWDWDKLFYTNSLVACLSHRAYEGWWMNFFVIC